MFALLLAVFVFTILIMNQLSYFLTRKQRLVANRLKMALDHSAQQHGEAKVRQKSNQKHSLKSLLALFGNMFSEGYLAKVQTNLVKSGVPLKAEEFAGLNIVTVILGVIIGQILLHKLILAVFLGLAGLVLPGIWLNVAKRRRTIKLEEQILDTTVLLANSLRAGHSLLQALEMGGKEARKPLAGEIGKLIRETQLAIPLEDALLNFSQRIDSKDIEMLVAGVLIQRQVGGNLAEVLDTIAATIEKRIKARAKIRALTAQGRLSAWIVSLLPFAIAAFIFGTHPEFGGVMLTEPLGQAMLVFGGVSMLIGILWIRKVIDVEV